MKKKNQNFFLSSSRHDQTAVRINNEWQSTIFLPYHQLYSRLINVLLLLTLLVFHLNVSLNVEYINFVTDFVEELSKSDHLYVLRSNNYNFFAFRRILKRLFIFNLYAWESREYWITCRIIMSSEICWCGCIVQLLFLCWLTSGESTPLIKFQT